MRFLMKITIPSLAENAIVGDPEFEAKLRALFLSFGALATYSNSIDGRRLDYVLVDLVPARITATAESVFRFLGTKPEFLPEVVPQPYYGRTGY
jgi:hypothetical protein